MSGVRYQAFYCEENVFHLLAEPALAARRRFALFVTNPARQVAIWQQRLAASDEPVVWDYHVVAVTLGPAGVWDLDSRLPSPTATDDYLRASFRDLPTPRWPMAPQFRLVEHAELRTTFASDRRHMRAANGVFREPPPPWPAPGSGHTLERYLDLDDPIAGVVARDVVALRALLAALEASQAGGA